MPKEGAFWKGITIVNRRVHSILLLVVPGTVADWRTNIQSISSACSAASTPSPGVSCSVDRLLGHSELKDLAQLAGNEQPLPIRIVCSEAAEVLFPRSSSPRFRWGASDVRNS